MALKLFGANAFTRRKLLPDFYDSEIAAELWKISDTIDVQAMRDGHYAWHLSDIPAVAKFINNGSQW